MQHLLGEKHTTSENPETFWDKKKSHNLLGQKKSRNLLEQNKNA